MAQRLIRIDENVTNAGASNYVKLQASKLDAPRETKRAALTEIINKVKTEPDTTNKDNISKDKKLVQTFEHIKPKVDTHWRKKVTSIKEEPAENIVKEKPKVVLKKPTLIVEDKYTKPKTIIAAKLAPKENVKFTVTLKNEGRNPSPKKYTKIPSMLRKNSSTSSSSSSLQSTESSDTERPVTHSSKLLSQVEDIDINDQKSTTLLGEYANDIYSYLFHMEQQFKIEEGFLRGQLEVSHRMRSVLIDWINEVHCQFKLEVETYYMAVSLIDRYLQVNQSVSRKNLQLVGVTALFIASKYEELYPPEIGDFVYITDETYDKRTILEMERNILKALNFELGKPLPIHFLRRFSKAAKVEAAHSIAKYFIELASIEYSLCHISPSHIAAAALYLALKMVAVHRGTSSWNSTIQYYSRYNSEKLQPVIKALAQVIKNAGNSKQKAIFTKYSSSKYSKVALNPEFSSGLIDKFL